MAKDFDATSKELFDRYPRDWLAMLGWPVPPTDDGLTIVDSDLSVVSPVADKLVRVDGVPSPYLAHVEFQTSGDAGLDERMLRYNVLARRQGLPVRSVAFLFRPAAAAGPTGGLSDHADAHSWIEFSYRLVRLWERPVDPMLTGPLGTLPLAPLAAAEGDLPLVLARLRRRLNAEVDRDRIADLLEYTRRLLGLRFDVPLWEAVMPSLQRLIETESSEYLATIRRGRTEGRLQGRHELLIEQGTEKFGPPDAATVARVEAVVDEDHLRRLARRLLRAETWDELLTQA